MEAEEQAAAPNVLRTPSSAVAPFVQVGADRAGVGEDISFGGR